MRGIFFDFFQFLHKRDRQNGGNDHRNEICGRCGVENAFDAEEDRKDADERNEADDISDHGGDYREHGFADRLKEDGSHFDRAGKRHEGEEDAEGQFAEFPVALGIDVCGRAEHSNNGARGKLEQQGRSQADDDGAEQNLEIQFLDAVKFLGTHVVADDRLTAEDDPHDEVDDDGKYFTLDSDDCDGDIRAVLGHRAVFCEHDIADQRDDDDRHLRDKGRSAELQGIFELLEIGDKTSELEFERLRAEEVPQGNRKGGCLSDHGCNSRARHSPLATVNKHGVENNIDDCAREHGNHGYRRTAVGADHGVHHIGQHVNREER